MQLARLNSVRAPSHKHQRVWFASGAQLNRPIGAAVVYVRVNAQADALTKTRAWSSTNFRCGDGSRKAEAHSVMNLSESRRPAPVTHLNTMPKAAPKPCGHPGCGVLVRDGTSRCPKHPAAVWAKKPTATKRITGRRLQAQRAALFSANPLCVECQAHGRTTLATQRDHIVPLAEGGTDDDSNVQGLCRACHEAKSVAEAARGRCRSR